MGLGVQRGIKWEYGTRKRTGESRSHEDRSSLWVNEVSQEGEVGYERSVPEGCMVKARIYPLAEGGWEENWVVIWVVNLRKRDGAQSLESGANGYVDAELRA